MTTTRMPSRPMSPAAAWRVAASNKPVGHEALAFAHQLLQYSTVGISPARLATLHAIDGASADRKVYTTYATIQAFPSDLCRERSNWFANETLRRNAIELGKALGDAWQGDSAWMLFGM